MSSRNTSPNSSSRTRGDSRVCLIFLAFASFAQAQITGHVTDASTRQPLEGATIRLLNGSDAAPVKTGPDGSYAFSGIRPGTFLLGVSHPGHLPLPNDQAGIQMDRLKPGEQLTRDFVLTPACSITVHLDDIDSGKSVGHITLHLTRPGTTTRGVRFDYVKGVTSDANGDVVFRDLGSGRFLLWAEPQAREFDPAKPSPKRGFGESFYPGVPREDMAVPLTLAPGEQRTLDWRLQPRDLHRVTGTISADEQLELFVIQGGRTLIHGFLPRGGPFEIGGLYEGPWRILFRTASKTFGALDVNLTDRDLEDQKFSLQPAASLKVSVRISESDAPAPPNLALRLEPTLPDPRFEPVYTRFAATDLPPGQYYVALDGLPATHALTGISANRIES
ncbi:MAG TPA: carboxypeptidase-like regulatory domain-containing protein, partial [Bryobacteraceae bacterium]|nr:carboxypeptidase-like regulatory domain-containing protein [Bryobacteraceae bacterium]